VGRRIGSEEGAGGRDEGFEIEGLWEFGEDGVEHFGFVRGEGEEFFFAGYDDLDFWRLDIKGIGIGGRRTGLTVANR
jgi:hypothetical protein